VFGDANHRLWETGVVQHNQHVTQQPGPINIQSHLIDYGEYGETTVICDTQGLHPD
jgi:hypothetical protein